MEKKENIFAIIQRSERFPVILIGEGVIVGGIGGLVVILYRMLLDYAGDWLYIILNFIANRPLWIVGWFAALVLLAVLTAKLVSYEPLISGSGIPQLEGEIAGKIDQVWWRVLPAKFAGGFLCIFGGLALGREGPSIQLGAMVGKMVSRLLDRGKTEEKFLLTCGASAGLSAAFHAPLAGVMFSLEEVHKNFSVSVLVSVMSASITADFLATMILGRESVFSFDLLKVLPAEYYGLILALGIVLGIFGAFYNWFTLKVQAIYSHMMRLGNTGKIMIPFLCAGMIGLFVPEMLGTGHSLIEELTVGNMALGTMVFFLVGRFLFSAVSFGSGAPGGIFFPMLIIGAFIGGIFAQIGHLCFEVETIYFNNFVLLAMAGYFTAIVRAPLTGIILIFEMTGSVSQMLSLALVSIMAYIVATLLRSEPIYESLLKNLLKKRGEKLSERGREKVLTECTVMLGSYASDKAVRDVEWPERCLLVAVRRGKEEIIPKGSTKIETGDCLVFLTDETDSPRVMEAVKQICSEHLTDMYLN